MTHVPCTSMEVSLIGITFIYVSAGQHERDLAPITGRGLTLKRRGRLGKCWERFAGSWFPTDRESNALAFHTVEIC